jgi:hypothetical protein
VVSTIEVDLHYPSTAANWQTTLYREIRVLVSNSYALREGDDPVRIELRL